MRMSLTARILAWAGAAVGVVVGVGAAAPASATWSIILIDTRTGEVAVASATCLTGFDLQANTPVLLTGVGAGTAQSSVDQNGVNRTLIRDGLLAGDSMEAILAGLEARDSNHQTRQYGIADVRGGALTFSGSRAGLWAGGRTGRVGDLVYAVQGNVLTGSPVVDEAVRAIETTPGDVAAKLMAAMEAARAMGGDGRCSCAPNDADGCGSPPPQFEKAAHIAYMLIARAGDEWNCRGAYRTQSAAADLLTLDGDGDGRLDLYLGASQAPAGLLSLMRAPSRVIQFADAAVTPAAGPVRGLAAGDMDGDGAVDLMGTNGTADRVVFLRRTGASFVVGGTFAAGDNPGPIVVADFDGDGRRDVATGNTSTPSVSVLLGRGDGSFGAETRIQVPAAPVGLAAGDFDGDGRLDLATAHAGNARSITALTGDGRGGFIAAQPRTGLTFAPAAILARDVTGDGRPELIFCGGSSVVIVRDLAQPASDVTLTATNALNCLDVADVDGDGVMDVLTASGGGTLSIFRGLGNGAFAAPAMSPMGFGATRIAARDFDGDGDLDLVFSVSSGTVVAMTNVAGPGRMPFFENTGCASGSGFMEFNVANQQAGDLDPVFQLRAMYDVWREGLERVADAVRSTAEWEPRSGAPADGRTNRTLRVKLRDWRGDAVSGTWSVEARRSDGADAVVERVIQVAADEFEIVVRAGRGCGVADFEVRAIGQERTVTLMPTPRLELGSPADANDDGFVDFFDYDDFVARYEAADPSADEDGDGAVTLGDYEAFVRAFEQGC